MDWTALFGRIAPLMVEIGFGNGDHLIHLAKTNPSAYVIGFEISSKSMDKAEKKIRNQQITNCVAIHGRGETALYHLFEPASIQEIHVNYPDPWFKSRHEGRRWMQPDTVNLMVSRLQADGLFHLATDIVEYAQMSDELLRQTPQLTNELPQPWMNEHPNRFTTKYEAKGLREGRAGNYFLYRRNHAPSQHIPTVKELEMPHVILETPMTLEAIAASFDFPKVQHGDIYVSGINVYINPVHASLLFEVNVREETIEQHVGVLLFPQDEANRYILRLSTLGHARPTLGLHYAVASLADWIVGLDESARIVAKKVRTQ